MVLNNKTRCAGRLALMAGALALVSIVLLLHFSGAAPGSFIGSRVHNPNHYSITFTMMNCSDEAVFHLEEGDVIEVDYQMDKGKMSMSIGMENEGAIYSGNFVDQGRFTLTAHKTGAYIIHVDAHKAAGYLNIKLKE